MQIFIDVPDERFSDLLCCAFEGGSNYWYWIDRDKSIITPRGQYLSDQPMAGGILWMTATGDGEKFSIHEIKHWLLDRNAMQRGLQLMATKYPAHFADFMAENYDAITGDVFLQLALFGEVIFG